MNAYQRALREFQDYADDVTRARYRSFGDAIQRFASTLTPGTPIGDVAAELPAVDFDAWYQAQHTTVRSMVGSGRLTWPDDRRERLAMQVGLVRGLAAEQPDILEFTHNFMWARNNFDDNVAEFVQQLFRPFTRDFLRFVHDTPGFVAGLHGHTANGTGSSKETITVERTELVQVADRVMRQLYNQETQGETSVAALVTTLGLSGNDVALAMRYAQKQGWITLTSVFDQQLPVGVDVTREGMQYAERLMRVRPEQAVASHTASHNTYHVSGHGARVNVNSLDASVNVVHGDANTTLFEQIEDAVESGVADTATRDAVLTSVRALRDAPDAPTRAQRLGGLLQVGANVMTVLAPFLPQLMQLATQ